MAGAKGDKVGDAYIEVHAIVDDKSVKSSEAKLNAAAAKSGKVQRAEVDRTTDHRQAAINDILRGQLDSMREEEEARRTSLRRQNRLLREAAEAQRALDRRTHAEQTRLRRDADRAIRRQSRDQMRRSMDLTARLNAFKLRAERSFASQRERVIRRSEDNILQLRALSQRAQARLARLARIPGPSAGDGGGPIGPNGGGRRRARDGGSHNFGEAFENLTSILPGQLEKLLRNPKIAAAAALLGNEIIGLIGAAMGSAIALGTLAGGIALAISKDKRLQEAGKALGKQLFSGLQDAAHDTLGKEIEKAFEFLKGSNFAGGIVNDFRSAFGALAPTIVPFVSDLAHGLSTISMAIRDFVTGSGAKIIELIGDGFVQVSDAVAGLIQDLDEAGPGMRSLVQDIFSITSALVTATGKVITFSASVRDLLDFKDTRTPIEKFGNMEEFFRISRESVAQYDKQLADGNLAAASRSAIEQARAGTIKVMGEATALLAEKYNQERGAALATAKANGTLKKSKDEVNAATAQAIDLQSKYDSLLQKSISASINYEQAIDDLDIAIKENGRTLNTHTQKGRDNFRQAEEVAKGAKDIALEVYNSTGSLEAAKKKYGELTKPLRDNFNNTEANRKKLKELNAAYGDFSQLPDIKKNVSVQLKNFNEVAAAVRSLTGNKTLSINVIKRNVSKDPNAFATGGAVKGPGTGTSDSIPANLSNGEFVIKASSASKIGMSNLKAMNNTGKVPTGLAAGGVAGYARGGIVRSRTGAQVAQFKALQTQIAALTTVIRTQTAQVQRWNENFKTYSGQFTQFVNLGGLNAEGASAGDLIKQLLDKKTKALDFKSQLQGLKGKGLSAAALTQLADAGPDSDLAKILNRGLQPVDIQQINHLLSGARGYGTDIANVLGSKPTAGLASNKKRLAAKKKAAAKLKPPRAKGATIKYGPSGRAYAVLSAKEIADQRFKTDQYVTVIIDGKEVRAIVKKEQSRSSARANQKIKSGRS